MGDPWSPLILALTGVFTAISGYYLAKSGRNDSKRQQSIADQVAKDKAELAIRQQALDAYEQVQDMHLEEIRRLHDQNEVVEELLRNERKRCERERDAASASLLRSREVVLSMINVLMDHRAGASKHGPELTKELDAAIESARALIRGDVSPDA